jgi:hypothetical protein
MQFIGLISFKNLLTNLQTEFDKIPEVKSQLDSISGKGLSGLANTAKNDIASFAS